MAENELGSLALALGALLGAAHLLGHLFERLKQPRLAGEILAGVLLGPFLGNLLGPSSSLPKVGVALNALAGLGLLLLMFVSGSGARNVLAREDRRQVAILISVGLAVPFTLILFLGLNELIPLETLMGPAAHPLATLLILAIAVAVASIPVISRIFLDLGLLRTRFASLILGAAMLEDVLLWAVLAVATSLAVQKPEAADFSVASLGLHTGLILAFIMVGLLVIPGLLGRVSDHRWNLLRQASPAGYAFVVLFGYSAAAAAVDVNLAFAAFLAGFGLAAGSVDGERAWLADATDAIGKVASAVFVPIYFALVGQKLALGEGFSLELFLAFLLGSSALALLARGVAARLAGFRGLEIANIAVTSNARGGPGIVLASVALEAGIISVPFYTALVLTAVLTSQAAGVWLRFVLVRGWPLLKEERRHFDGQARLIRGQGRRISRSEGLRTARFRRAAGRQVREAGGSARET